ncbi:MAG: glycoside hydrolase [Gemmatimonadaceae bacterium]|nr:glycoside hydrolase [Gemmatimonadaceae bacterium]
MIRRDADRPTVNTLVRAPGQVLAGGLLSTLLLACAGAGEMPTAPSTLVANTSAEVTGALPALTSENVFQRGVAAMSIPTYDGSGEAVHPDVVSFPEAWNGFRYWSAFTPYKNSAITLENPSLLGSQDGRRWESPTSSFAPLVKASHGHLSDPDMIFERASRQLWMYYREVELQGGKPGGAHVADHIWLTRSSDGRQWDTPVELFADKGKYVVSPSIVQHPTDGFQLFAVDAGTGGCNAATTRLVRRQSADGLTWSDAKAVRFTQTGFQPWHLDVQYVADRGEYWAFVVAYPTGKGCHASSLFLATSRDGETWTTYPRPILAPREFAAFGTTVYRSTFAAEGDSVSIWYSGARQTRRGTRARGAVLQWSLAAARTSVATLFTRVADKSGLTRLSLAPAAGAAVVGVTPP